MADGVFLFFFFFRLTGLEQQILNPIYSDKICRILKRFGPYLRLVILVITMLLYLCPSSPVE